MADTDEPQTPGEYRPKPRLWRSTHPDSRPSFLLTTLVLSTGVAVLVLGALGGETTFLSTPATPVEVIVARVDSVAPPNDGPAGYQYAVTMPDGSIVRYTSPAAHRVGDRVVVMQSRGRLTGRVLLRRPQSAVSRPEQ